MGLAVRGIQEVRANIQRLQSELRMRISLALMAEMDIEKREMTRPGVCPFDTGRARRSHVRHKTEWKGNTAQCAITAGGAEAPYVPIIHNDPEIDFKNGIPFWMTATLMAAVPYMGARVAKRLELWKSIKR